MGLVTLTFDLLTLKLVCESHQRWGTFVSNRPSGSRVIRYVRNGWTDRQKQTLLPYTYGRGHKNATSRHMNKRSPLTQSLLRLTS